MKGADSAQELPPLTPEEPSQLPLTRVAQRFAVLATLLLPIAVVPYLVTRRQISTLRTQVRESGLAAAQLQGRWRGALKEAAAVHDLHAQTQGLLDRTRQELRALQRETGELRDKFEASSVEGETRREENVQLRGLVEELCRGMNRLHDVGERHETVLQQLPQSREQSVILRELGRSLADVAAFMHEVELEQGFSVQRPDQRGIDRLRTLALRMQEAEGTPARSAEQGSRDPNTCS